MAGRHFAKATLKVAHVVTPIPRGPHGQGATRSALSTLSAIRLLQRPSAHDFLCLSPGAGSRYAPPITGALKVLGWLSAQPRAAQGRPLGPALCPAADTADRRFAPAPGSPARSGAARRAIVARPGSRDACPPHHRVQVARAAHRDQVAGQDSANGGAGDLARPVAVLVFALARSRSACIVKHWTESRTADVSASGPDAIAIGGGPTAQKAGGALYSIGCLRPLPTAYRRPRCAA